MSIKGALAGGGALLVAAAFLLGTLFGEQAQPMDNALDAVSSPADVRCRDGWTETEGKEPDSGLSFDVCTSEYKRYTITIRE